MFFLKIANILLGVKKMKKEKSELYRIMSIIAVLFLFGGLNYLCFQHQDKLQPIFNEEGLQYLLCSLLAIFPVALVN